MGVNGCPLWHQVAAATCYSNVPVRERTFEIEITSPNTGSEINKRTDKRKQIEVGEESAEAAVMAEGPARPAKWPTLGGG